MTRMPVPVRTTRLTSGPKEAAMPFGLGFSELLLVFGVVVLFFGGKRLPEVASGMGKGIRDFRRALSGVDEDSVQAAKVPPAAATPAVPTPEEPKRLG
ncbi:MAG: twin-arginine translocation protein TatA/E family subunit [Gemmatimonadetes bacterium]|nr:twin-arginine translocation protein TatA/E family subunit [Gemmatimonadota bacterium]